LPRTMAAAASFAALGFAVLACSLVLRAQEPQNQSTTTQTQESANATRMRVFLGLGRTPDAKVAAAGAKLFGPTCGFCHGANARGGVGPDLLRSSVVLDDNQGEVLGPVIRKGFPDKGMPGFPALTDEQVREIAEFLHEQVYLAANRGTYEIQNIVTGDARAGEAYFNSEGKCNSCHSSSGDLAHIASKLKPLDVQNAFLYPAAVGTHPPPRVTVTLKDGTAISGTLKYLDDFYVSLDAPSGNLQSIKLEPGVKVNVEDKLVFHRKMLEKYSDAEVHDVTAYLVTLK
jgi:cytochrome c oxidase cbb3-type subunit 3